MNDKHRRDNERGQRSDGYMDAAAEDFPEGSKAATLAATLKELLAEASALDVALAAAARKRQQGTEGRERTRTELRQMLRTLTVATDAAAIEHPDIRGIFRPPLKRNSDQSLIAAARSAADAAAPLAGLLSDFGLPPGFFNDMRAKADSIESYAALQASAVSEGVNANAGLDDVFRRMDEVIDRLHPIITSKYAADPAKLAAWESARRLERAPRRQPDDDDDTPPPPPTNT